MAKASITLTNGTVVQIEGSTEEVRELLEFYGAAGSGTPAASKKKAAKKTPRKKASAAPSDEPKSVDITAIVNLVKSCEEAEDVEVRILDKASQVNRTLLPLYMVHEYLEDDHALSSGDINKVTTQLSVPVATPNASRTLSGTASKYVIGDTTRKRGATVRYKLNRRGVKYMKAVISGDSSDK